MSNIVAIVGRPNVGKSTFFNRLIQQRKAIVHESSGVTRDRHYGITTWNGQEFSLIDTGGYVHGSDDVFEDEIRKQVLIAIEEADVILFLVDLVSGITDLDNEIANLLRRMKKPLHLVVNKVDNSDRYFQATEFYALGLGDYFAISAINGSGTGELLDAVVKDFKEEVEQDNDETDNLPKFAIVGRPNVGKSSFINSLLGKERNIVTPIAGTTRDSINTRFTKYGHDFILIDTAGVRKKSKVSEDIEYYSVMRTIRAIENCDVALLMIDAERGVEAQDINLFQVIQKNSKGLVVLINKWDLIEKETNSIKEFTQAIHEKFAPFNDFPIIFVSALTKQRILKALDEAVIVNENRTRKVPTSKLNEIMLAEIERHLPPAVKGKVIKIKYVTQLPTLSPCFAFFCNLPQYIGESYMRYLENRIRENFDFTGVTIKIFMRKK